jgi:MoaA/NifB/PqqE/SkfB family radical SAM enzyme
MTQSDSTHHVRAAGYYHFLDERQRDTLSCAILRHRPSLWRVAIHLLSHCSLACEYCRVNRFPNALVQLIGQSTWLHRMTSRYEASPALHQLLGQALDLGARHVHLTGGEPTLIDDLPQLVLRCSEAGTSTSLVTSGASPNTSTGTYCNSLVHAGLGAVSVSLDSPDPITSDRMTRVSGAHAATVECIRRLVAAGSTRRPHPLRVYLQMVVTRHTLRDLPGALTFAATLGVDDVKLLLVKGVPSDWLTPDDISWFRSTIATEALAIANAHGFEMVADDIGVLLMDDSMGALVREGRYYRPYSGPCYLSLSELTVACNGDVYPCVYHMWDSTSCAGPNIIAKPLKVILATRTPPSGTHPICAKGCTRRIVDSNRCIDAAIAHNGIDGLGWVLGEGSAKPY